MASFSKEMRDVARGTVTFMCFRGFGAGRLSMEAKLFSFSIFHLNSVNNSS